MLNFIQVQQWLRTNGGEVARVANSVPPGAAVTPVVRDARYLIAAYRTLYHHRATTDGRERRRLEENVIRAANAWVLMDLMRDGRNELITRFGYKEADETPLIAVPTDVD